MAVVGAGVNDEAYMVSYDGNVNSYSTYGNYLTVTGAAGSFLGYSVAAGTAHALVGVPLDESVYVYCTATVQTPTGQPSGQPTAVRILLYYCSPFISLCVVSLSRSLAASLSAFCIL
jgi:hypothetical protein